MHHQMEYAMFFLICLNYNFGYALGQILFMDPLPLINCILALISNEECQRTIKKQDTSSNRIRKASFTIMNNLPKNKKLALRTMKLVEIKDHISRYYFMDTPKIEKYYKLHSYSHHFAKCIIHSQFWIQYGSSKSFILNTDWLVDVIGRPSQLNKLVNWFVNFINPVRIINKPHINGTQNYIYLALINNGFIQ